jgi:geranylgeranyl reductase family protein
MGYRERQKTMDERFDLVVVGAGPAGSCAAREAALRGAGTVLLLEREQWPRDKVCAGGLSPPARRVLRRMGLWPRVLPLGYPIRAARLRTPGGRDLLVSGRRTSLVIRRRLLDALLAEQAVRAGAVLRTGCRAQGLLLEQGRVRGVKAGGVCVRARRVILASGAGSPFGLRPLPALRWLACLARYEAVPFEPHTIELFFDPELFPRYGWLFPESASQVNVGFCLARGQPQGPPPEMGPRELLQRFLRRNLGGRMDAARPLGRPRLHPIIPCSRVRHRSLPGTLLAGDCLGLINPFTGEGLSYALASGRLAGRMAACALRSGWTEPRIRRLYGRALRSSLEPSLRLGDWISRRGRPLLHLAARAAGSRLGGRLIYRALS